MASGPSMPVSRPRVETLEAALAFPPTSPSWPNQSTASHNREIEIEVEEEVPVTANPLVPDDVVKKYDQVMDEMKRIRGALGQRARRKRRMRVAALDDSDASLDMESETGAPLPPYPPALGSPRPMAAYPLVAEPAPPFRTPPEAAATAQATAAMADAKAINCSSPASAVGGEPTTRTLPTPFAPTAQQKSHRSKSPGFSVRRLKSTKTPPANPTSSSSSALSASSGSGFLTHLHSKLSRTPILGNRLPATQSPPEPVKEASARPSPRTPLPPLEMDESGAFIVHTARPSLLSPVYHATTPMPGRTLPALDLDDPNAFVAVSPVEAPDGWFRSQPGTPQLPVHSTKPRQLKVRNVAESDSQSASSSQSTSPVHPPVPCQQPTLAAASLPLNSISSPHSPPSLVSFSPQSSTTAKAPSTAPPSSPPPSFTTQPTLARVTKRPSPLVCAPTPATNGTGLPNGPSELTPLPFTPVTSVAKHSYAPSPQAAPITATTTAELPLTATLPTSPFAQAYETHSSPPPMALADSSRQSLSVDSLSMESHISVSASTYPRHILRQAQRQAESQGQAHIPTAAAALMPPSPTTTRVPNSARQRWCPQNQDLSSRVISQHSFGAGSSFGHHSFSYTPSYAGRPSFFGDDDTSAYYHGSEGWGQSSLSRYRSLRKRASDSAIHRRHCLEQNQQGMKHLHRFRSVKETIAPISAVQGYPVDPPLGRWRTRAPPTTPGQWQDSVAQGLLPSPAPALLPSFIAASVLTPPPHPAAAELALDRPARSLVTSPAQVYLSVQLSNSGAPTLNSSSFKTSSSRDSTPPKATDCTASLLANSTSPKVYSMVRQPSPDLSPSLPSISETLLLSQVQPRVSAEPATILPVNYTNATPPPPLHEPTETAVIERPMVPPKLVLVVESMSSPTKSSIELDLEIAELDRELASMTSHLNSQSFIAPNTYSDGIDDFHGQDGLLPDAEAIIGRGSADGVGPTSPIVAMAAHAHEMPSFSSASMDPLHSSLVVAVDAEPRRWVNNAAPGTAVVSSTATHADTSHRLLPSPMAICAQPSLTVPLQPLLSPESAVEPLLQPNNAIDSHSIQSALSQSIPAVLPFSNNTAQLEAPMTEQSVERPFTRATTPPVLAPIALSPPATQPPFAGTLLSPNATVSATPTSRGDSVPLPVTHCSQAEPSKAPMPHDPHTLPTRGATADPKPANRPLPTAASTSPARTLRIDTRIRPADQVPLAPSPEAQRRPSLTNARSGARRASQRAARDLLQELESELSMELARLSSSTPRSATVPSRPLVPDVPPRPQWSDTVLHPLSQPATPLSPALSAELPSSPRLHSPQGHLAGAARGQATIKHLEDAGGHSLPNSQPLGAEPVVRRHPSRESLDILATMEAFPFPPSMRSEHSISQLSPLTRPVSATSTVSPTSPFSKPVMAQQRIRPSSQRSKESVMDALSSIMESLQHDMATPVTPIQRQAMVLAQREALSVQPSPPVVPEKSSPTVQEPINEPRLSAASAGPNSAAIASLDALLADLAPSVQAQADAATAAPTQAVDSGINSPSVSASCDEISPKNRRVSLDMPHQNALSSSTMSPRSDGHIAKPIGVSEAASQALQRNSQTRSPVEQATPGDESATYLNYADYGATDDTMPQSIFSPASPAESATPATGTGCHSHHSPLSHMPRVGEQYAGQVDANLSSRWAPTIQTSEHSTGGAVTLEESDTNQLATLRTAGISPVTSTHVSPLSSAMDTSCRLDSKGEPRPMGSGVAAKADDSPYLASRFPDNTFDISIPSEDHVQTRVLQHDQSFKMHPAQSIQDHTGADGKTDWVCVPDAHSNCIGLQSGSQAVTSTNALRTKELPRRNHSGYTSPLIEPSENELSPNFAASHSPRDDSYPITPPELASNCSTPAPPMLAYGLQRPLRPGNDTSIDCYPRALLGDVSVHSEVRRDAQDRRISTERATNGRSSPLVPSASSDPLPTTESATNQSAHLAGNPLLSPPALQTSPQIENFHCHHEPFEKEDGSFAYSVQRPDTFPEWSQQASAGSAGQSPAKQPVVSDSLPAMGLSSVNHSPQSLASLTIDALSPDPIAPHDGSSARHRELSPIVEGNQKHEFASSMVGAQPSFEINDFSEVTDSVYARRGRPSLHSLRSIQTSYSQTRTWSISSIELSPDSVSRRPYFSPLRAGFSPQNGEFSADIAPETYPDMVQTGLKTVVPYLQIPGNDAFQRETIHINPKSEPPSFVEMAPPPTTPLSIGHRATEPTDVVAFPRLDTSGGTSALESESEIDSSADETEGPEEIVQFGLIASPGFATQANNGERVVSLQPARRVRLSSFSGSQKSIPSTPRHEKVTVTTAVVPFSGHTALAEQGSPLSADSDAQGKFLTVPSVISPSRVNGCQPSSRRSLSAQMVSETPRSSDQARSNENIKVQPMAQSPSQLHTDDERPPGIVATTGTTGHLAAAIPVVTEAKVVDATMARPAHMPLPVKAELPLNQLDQVACTRDDCGLPETITNGRAMVSEEKQSMEHFMAATPQVSVTHVLPNVHNPSYRPHHEQQQPQRSLARVDTQGAAAHAATLPPLAQAPTALSLPTPRRSDDGGERLDSTTLSAVDLAHTPPIKHASVLSNVSPVSAHEDAWIVDPLPQPSPATSCNRMSNESLEHVVLDASPPVLPQAVDSVPVPLMQVTSALSADTSTPLPGGEDQTLALAASSLNGSSQEPRPVKVQPPPVAVPPPPLSLSTLEPKPSKTMVSRSLAALVANPKTPKGDKAADNSASGQFEIRTVPRQSHLMPTPPPLPQALGARSASPRRSVFTPDRLSTISMGALADMAQEQSLNAVLAYQWEQINPRFSSVATSVGADSPPTSPARFNHQPQPQPPLQRPTSHLAGEEFAEFESFMNFSFTADDHLSSGARTPSTQLPRPPLQIHDASDALKSSVTDSLQQLLGQALPPLYTATPANKDPLPEKQVPAKVTSTAAIGPTTGTKPTGAWSTLSNWWSRSAPPSKAMVPVPATTPAQASAAAARPQVHSIAQRTRRPPGARLMGHSLCGRIMQAQADCPLYATGNWCKLWRSLRTRQIFLSSMEIPVNLDELDFYSVYSPAIRRLALSSPHSSMSGSMVLPDNLYRQSRSFNSLPNASRFDASRSFRPVPFQRNQSVPTGLSMNGALGASSPLSSFVGTPADMPRHQSQTNLGHHSMVRSRNTSTLRREMGNGAVQQSSFSPLSVAALDVASIRKLCSEPQDALSYLSEQDLVYLVEHLQLTSRAVRMQTEHFRSKADQLRAQIVTNQAMAEQLAAVPVTDDAKAVPGPRRRIVVTPSSGTTPLSSPMSGTFSPGLVLREQSPPLAQFPHRRHPSQDSIAVTAGLPSGVPMSPSATNQSLITSGLGSNGPLVHPATKQSFQSARSREPNWRLEEKWEQQGGPLQSPSTLSAVSRASGSSNRSVNIVSRAAAKPMFATKRQIVYMAPAATAKTQ